MASWRLKHPGQLADGWKLSGTADSFFGRYPGTLVNTPTWGTFLTGRGCIELDGNDQHVNMGDVAELNAVSAFSICFWMAQDVLDTADYLFFKYISATNQLLILTTVGGDMQFNIYNGAATRATFDYSTVISVGNWHHVAAVFDGSQAAAAAQLVVYVDGNPVALTFPTGTMAATTGDMAGADAHISYSVEGFDGKLYDYRIASCALSRDEIIAIIHEAVPVMA